MNCNDCGADIFKCRCNIGQDDEFFLHENETIDVPTISGTFPVVLYLGSEEDREEMIQALMEIKPNMKSRKL